MKRLRRGTSIAAAVTLLLLAAPVGSAAAAPSFDDRPPTESNARTAPHEPTGRLASVNAMRSGSMRCGEVITRSTTLTADVGPCPGNGIIVGADNIMLNLNGHTISGIPGPGSGNDGGIRLPNRTGVRVTGLPGNSAKKGTVTGFDAGVVVNGGSGNTIENLDVRDNIGSQLPDSWYDPAWWEPPAAELGDGIVLFKSASNRIINNVVTNNGVYDGIGVLGLGSDFNVVQENTVHQTVGLAGNPSAGGAGIIINHFLDQRPGTGLVISGNKALGNTVRTNTGSGISNVGHVDGQIVGNVVEDNALWIRPFATFLYVPSSFSANGIGVQAGVGQQSGPDTNMLITDNLVNRNGLNGLFITGAGNRVETNKVFGNGAIGVFTRNSFEGPPNNITHNDTGENYILDLFDEVGYNFAMDGIDRCPNAWSGNTWGPLQPGAQEAEWLGSFEAAYAPDCTAAGGSGPNAPAS